MPKTGGFSFSKVPRPPFPLSRFRRPLRPLFFTTSGCPLWPATTYASSHSTSFDKVTLGFFLQRSDKKLMQNGNDIGYDRRQIHSREGGDNHAVPLARRHGLYTPRLTGRGSVVPDMWGQAHRLRSSSSPSVHPQWACACRL